MVDREPLTYPLEYEWLRAHGLHGLTPWYFIRGESIENLTRELYAETGRVAIAFARRRDQDDVAFFVVDDGAIPGRVVSAHLSWKGSQDDHAASSLREHPSIWRWLSDEVFPATQDWVSAADLKEIQAERGPFSDQFLEDYEKVCGRGSTLELKLRILADKTPNLQRFAHDRQLKSVEDAIIDEFADVLSGAEQDRLKTSRELRNKVLHCDFRVARDKLADLGHENSSGGVMKIDIRTGETLFVSDTARTRDGGVFGWLLESATSGDLARAYLEFSKTAALVDRLIRHVDERAEQER